MQDESPVPEVVVDLSDLSKIASLPAPIQEDRDQPYSDEISKGVHHTRVPSVSELVERGKETFQEWAGQMSRQERLARKILKVRDKHERLLQEQRLLHRELNKSSRSNLYKSSSSKKGRKKKKGTGSERKGKPQPKKKQKRQRLVPFDSVFGEFGDTARICSLHTCCSWSPFCYWNCCLPWCCRSHNIRIELKVKDLDQLFLTYDPNPFYAKQLDSAAEEFIKYYAEMENEGEHFELVIRCEEDWRHGNSRFTAEDVRDAIRANFLRRARETKQQLIRLLNDGKTSLLIGLTVMLVALGISNVISASFSTSSLIDNTWTTWISQSIQIIGWVALWQPAGVFLYDWWPLIRSYRMFNKLAKMKVHVKRWQSRALSSDEDESLEEADGTQTFDGANDDFWEVDSEDSTTLRTQKRQKKIPSAQSRSFLLRHQQQHQPGSESRLEEVREEDEEDDTDTDEYFEYSA